MWNVEQRVQADGSGRVRLPADLLGSMTSVSLASSFFLWPAGGARFTVTVASGGRVAHESFRRTPVHVTRVEVPRFSGVFFARPGAGRRPAVLAFGGSEGGRSSSLETIARLFAANGFPTLAIGYFGLPGRPATLDRIPLEYFAAATRWLRERPEVAPDHVLALGVSRGSEAAQLLAVHFPRLVHGVVAVVPSNTTLCAPHTCGVAWTLAGKPLPYSREIDDVHPTDVPAAVIRDERIDGPVLAVCGRRDTVWTSCAYGRAIVRRLDAHRDRHAHRLIETDGGHFVASLVPYQPHNDYPGYELERVRDERARERIWPEILEFLKEHA